MGEGYPKALIVVLDLYDLAMDRIGVAIALHLADDENCHLEVGLHGRAAQSMQVLFLGVPVFGGEPACDIKEIR